MRRKRAQIGDGAVGDAAPNTKKEMERMGIICLVSGL